MKWQQAQRYSPNRNHCHNYTHLTMPETLRRPCPRSPTCGEVIAMQMDMTAK
jgi:hypothetical protein